MVTLPNFRHLPKILQSADLQLGCVVNDLDSAMAMWSATTGAGPWIVVDDFSAFGFTYNDQPSDIRLTVAFAYFRDIQIELIHPEGDAPSPHREYLDAGGDGIHHLGFFCPDYAASIAAVEAAGMQRSLVIAAPGEANKTIYFESPNKTGPMIEVVHRSPGRVQAYDVIRQAGLDWNGENPVRRYHQMAEFLQAQKMSA